MEVFIINDVITPLKKYTKKSAILVKKHLEEKHIKPSVVKPYESITIESSKVEQPLKGPSSAVSKSSDTVSSNHSEENKSKIINAEFGTVYGPNFIHREVPVYPQIARKLGKEGKVILRLTLNERGELINVEIIESAPYGFTESAIEAVKKSRFSPAIKDSKPIACRAILPIRFVLKN